MQLFLHIRLMCNSYYYTSFPCSCNNAVQWKVIISTCAVKIKWPLLEMQRYTFWVYRYITSFVLQYSDILHDTVWLIFADRQNLFPKPSCFIPTNQLQNCNLAYNRSISHKTVYIICSVEVKTWIYQARYSIYADIRYIDTV